MIGCDRFIIMSQGIANLCSHGAPKFGAGRDGLSPWIELAQASVNLPQMLGSMGAQAGAIFG